MAIDTSMFGAPLPTGTYTAGDIIPLPNIRGPAVVRDGYGPAKLKRMVCGLCRSAAGSIITGHVIVKNSNWIDEISNFAGPVSSVSLAENSTNIQRGHDSPLVPNSGWQVAFIVDETVTTTADNDVFCLIDVDYPSVQAVQNPRTSEGVPVSMIRNDTIIRTLFGTINAAVWNTFNVDVLKAGYRYLLVELGAYMSGGAMAFVSISNAAGQNGLERIIPSVATATGNLRYLLDYSTPLVKGPMNINYMVIGATGSGSILTEIDWVRNK